MTAPDIDPATESTLWAAIEAAPDDDAPKLRAADWYFDHGDDEMAAGLRYAVAEGKWPEDYGTSHDRPITWFGHYFLSLPEFTNDSHRSVLPEDILRGRVCVDFFKFPAALRWLGGRVLEMDAQ